MFLESLLADQKQLIDSQHHQKQHHYQTGITMTATRNKRILNGASLATAPPHIEKEINLLSPQLIGNQDRRQPRQNYDKYSKTQKQPTYLTTTTTPIRPPSRGVNQQSQATKCWCKVHQARRCNHQQFRPRASFLLFNLTLLLFNLLLVISSLSSLPAQASQSSIQVKESAYKGITLTFSNHLNVKDVVKDNLFDKVQKLIQDSSTFINEALNGRVYFGEVQILIPYIWNIKSNDLLPKPGQSVMTNRRILYKDADILVGHDAQDEIREPDPIFGQMPITIQHDGCAQYGHKIHLPANYTLATSDINASASEKARAFVREWASYRYGVFKENGYRNDPMYPPFYSIPGAHLSSATSASSHATNNGNKIVQATGCDEQASESPRPPLSGVDYLGGRCSPETDFSSGMPTASSFDCLPYPLAANIRSGLGTNRTANASSDDSDDATATLLATSNSIMYGDWYYEGSGGGVYGRGGAVTSAGWHFCGENFSPISSQSQHLLAKNSNDQQQSITNQELPTTGVGRTTGRVSAAPKQQQQSAKLFQHQHLQKQYAYYHDIDAPNKQNIMCQQRSAMDVIRQSSDFETQKLSQIAFNRLPATNFQFIKEEPPRFIIGVEYTQTLLANNRRMDSELLDAAIKKFISFDMIANSEVAVVWFGREQSQWRPFKRLDNNLDSRLKLYSPSFPAFNEPTTSNNPSMDEGGQDGGSLIDTQPQCSFAKLFTEAMTLWSQRGTSLDMDCDLVVVTSGNFIEDEIRLEEIHRTMNNGKIGLHLIIYPFQMDAHEQQHKLYIQKLIFIQNLFNARIHIIKEHQDADGNVKMTTLLQFFEIFEYMGKGHSWDQHDSYITLKNQNVNGTELKFFFDIDSTIENELIVGFIETKKFGITNLQLRSPSGQLVINDHTPDHSDLLFEYRQQLKIAGFHLKNRPLEKGTWLLSATSDVPIQTAGTAIAKVNQHGNTTMGSCWIQPQYETITEQPNNPLSSKKTTVLKSIKVFAQTKGDQSLTYIQNVAARMEIHDDSGHIVQNVDMLDDGLGMPDMTRGDGIHSQYVVRAQKPGYYKIVVELQGSTSFNTESMDGGNQDYTADQVVSNDYDVIPGYRQTLTNGTTRSSSSRLSGQDVWHPGTSSAALKSQRQIQDTPCCGSFIPSLQRNELTSTRYLNRQLYCGTFYIDEKNKLQEQKPARVNSLKVVRVDRAQRKVTVQWTEPTIDIYSYPIAIPNNIWGTSSSLSSVNSNNDSASNTTDQVPSSKIAAVSSRSAMFSRSKSRLGLNLSSKSLANEKIIPEETSSTNVRSGMDLDDLEESFKAKYEIKSFKDMSSLRDSVDIQEYSSWNVDGIFPNASSYGGTKEVVLRVPYEKAGVYYIVMRTYNNLGIGSDYSNIVRFEFSNNISDSDDLYNMLGSNIYNGYNGDSSSLDDNGPGSVRHGGASLFESLIVLGTISAAAFVFAISLVAIVFCLYNSNRNKASIMSSNSEDTKTVAGNGSSSASSSTSGCHSDIASSAASSQSGQDIVEISKISLPHNNNTIGTTNSNGIPHQQYTNIGSDISTLNINMPYLHHHHNSLPSPVSSTITVNHQNDHLHHLHHHHHHHHNLLGTLSKLGSIQNDTSGLMLSRSISQEKLARDYATPSMADGQPAPGLVTAISPVQSWPADILLSHYDKVKQAKERNEVPPVMRIENLDNSSLRPISLGMVGSVNQQRISSSHEDGLATANTVNSTTTNHHLDRQSYMNQQLQQQLNNVILNGPNNILRTSSGHRQSSPQTLDRMSTGSRATMMYNNGGAEGSERIGDFVQQVPPQYVYYNQNHYDPTQTAGSQQVQHPLENQSSSIYGQTLSHSVQNNSYYANQQSPWATLDQNQQHHEQTNDIFDSYQQVTNNDGYASVKKTSSAVSQV